MACKNGLTRNSVDFLVGYRCVAGNGCALAGSGAEQRRNQVYIFHGCNFLGISPPYAYANR